VSADGNRVQALPKHPPHSTDAEQSVLGGLIIQNQAWYAVSALVSEADFYTHEHRVIWREISAMMRAGLPVDIITLTARMRDAITLEDGGGFSYVASLAADTPSAANIEAYAERVREMSQRRKAIAIGQEMVDAAHSGTEASVLISKFSGGIDALLRSTAGKSKTFCEAVSDAEETINANRERRTAGGAIGAPTGLPSLDRLTGGFVGPRLIVIGARPGTGKTALLNQFALHSARRGFPGLVCSIEMGADELIIRALASEAGVNVTKIMRGYHDEAQAAYEAAARIGDIPLWLDTETHTVEGISGQIAAHKRRYGIQWAAVDHIGLIRTEQRFGSRNDQLGHISWSLKALAKRLGIPVIALSQLSRKGENESRRPREDDLRDSGNIEQDADVIILMHTPPDVRDQPVKPVELGVVKNRAGAKGWLSGRFEFDGPTQRFLEVAGHRG